jgi:hypothetical protein
MVIINRVKDIYGINSRLIFIFYIAAIHEGWAFCYIIIIYNEIYGVALSSH